MKNFIEEITKEAGKIVAGHYRQELKTRDKGGRLEVVTQADEEANEFLVKKIKEKFPDHGIISEELDDYQTEAEYIWIIDPLDGTHNYASGLSIFNVVVSLTKSLLPLYTAIYDPISGEYLFAETGQGASLNGIRVRCSQEHNLKNTLGLLHPVLKPSDYAYWERIIGLGKERNFLFKVLGSCSKSAYATARGAADWYVTFDTHIWDALPAVHVLKEAGCKVTNIQGAEWKPGDNGFVAANQVLHEQLIKILNGR